jgi:hypothetical protein
MGVGGQGHAPAAVPPVWTGAENLAPNGIQSPDRSARRESLYRLRYPRPPVKEDRINKGEDEANATKGKKQARRGLTMEEEEEG